MKWFKQYMKGDSQVIAALMKLTEDSDVMHDVKDALAQFVYLLHSPKGTQNHEHSRPEVASIL